MSKILVVGATSAIAVACCREWLTRAARVAQEDGVEFFLLGRRADRLEQIADDLRARGAVSVAWHALDLADTAAQRPALLDAIAALGTLDLVLVAHGTLPDQAACEADPDLAAREFSLNATATITLLLHLANHMAGQGHGSLAVITSVAGDRGRPSNYVYGSAKASVSVFCEGLRVRLFRQGVHVIDIRPGFVDTPMTKDLPLPRALVATPDDVARRIATAIERRKDVVYVPWFWALILWVIRVIPPPVFKRLSL